jgi:glutamine synthetase
LVVLAGLKAIGEGYEPPLPETVADVLELTDEERVAERLRALPQSLHDALREMEGVRAGRRVARRAHVRVVPVQQAFGMAPRQPAGHPVRVQQYLRTL